MDAVTAIQQRIVQIQSRIAELDPSRAGTLTAAASATSTSSPSASALAFGQVLGSVQAADATADVGYGAALVNADNVPYELVGYGNGKIPSSALSTISGTSHELWAPAARSFEAMRDAAARDGVTIGITDSYRSYDAQVDVAARKGLYSQGGLAAVPGTSNHGWGMALDLKLDDSAQAWIREHGGEYGFVEAVPREPWHWEYHPSN
ncbi:M15 family metallopeptidase [Actinotalea sp. M2MS4P-6]|uniref:M15 family metallopeptidase n=1 Tax=Actinotalea sp. M2MS4P-6 TaxID=2983762 RepID=UPI0021E3E23E|nr:M15 family metallopeptidase [Actinotalea sp. M2MS4P-6]MCV2392757.1 M15 family metallopeptidase [Actinotalea sp. M2MS4P-6]